MSGLLSSLSEPATAEGTLAAFAYGEHFEGERSLGFRLLSPDSPKPWSQEVEALARRLQAAPYPDGWPVAELYCSAVLDGGQRLIAIARYGLSDHTPSRRRGGLEMVGLIAPASLSMSAALSVGQWLRQKLAGLDRPTAFSGSFEVVEVLAEAPTPPPLVGATLPRPLGNERFLVIPATAANEPDHHISMIGQLHDRNWQWLPFVPPDFPLADLAERGPLLAWTTPATRTVQARARTMPAAESRSGRSVYLGLIVICLLGLLGVNAWYLWRIEQRLNDIKPVSKVVDDPGPAKVAVPSRKDEVVPADQEALAQALYQYLRARGCIPDNRREQLLKNYERLVAIDDSLRTGSMEGRLAIGAMNELARRKSPAQIEALIRGMAAEKKGIDERVLDLIAERMFQRLTENE